MTTIKQTLRGSLTTLAFGALFIALFLLQSAAVNAQWTTPDASQNINNTNTGNVGIGTTTPTNLSKLHVHSTGILTRILSETTSPTGYAELAVKGSGRTYVVGVGGGTENTYSVANKFFLFDADADAMRLAVDSSGNVGIGTTNPQFKLDVAGNINSSATITGNNIVAKYQDVAEWVPASRSLPVGTVVTLDPTKSNHVEASSQAYDTRVAGVTSAQPGITLGEKSDTKVLVATTGRVLVNVDATNGPIQIGDLLVTSDREGFAMKSAPVEIGGARIHRPGTLIGKALEPLAGGTGKILVLLSLQ